MEQNTVEFTAVLADDEYSVLEGVKTAIDWESLGIRIAALASNGHEALDAIIKYKPDLAIIDIRMPDLTGIQVIERCRNAGISTDFIILSGYDDFSYAKEAMRYGAKAYLLKPLNSTELTDEICLPIRQSPLRSRVPVLPLVVPIRVNEAEYAVVNITDEPSDVYVVVYLDCTKLLQSLTLASTGLAEGTYYLFTEDGVPLSPSSYDKKTNPLMLPETDALIRTLTETDETHTAAQTSDFYLAASHMAKSGLILLECVPKEPFYDIFGPTIDFLVIVLFLVVGILLVISRMMTRYITRPVTQLMAIVERIRENRYEHKQELGTGDEIGHLCTAINQMHDTIQKQMERIKQEESEKYMAEIRLLTEQINPHFLYNTLDCIQSEVKRGESDTAANMIQYLAEYLRIGLSNGADLIPLSSEIRHANAYVRLMNQRFGQSIRFMYHLAPGLSHHLIVKTILQPLVENSIKHGFGVDSPGIPISTPAIEVIITAEEDELVININDNGSGFEPSELDELLKKSSTAKGGHVGILNVYQRLTAYYGAEKVYISFSSIPYYCNVISIRIPLGS